MSDQMLNEMRQKMMEMKNEDELEEKSKSLNEMMQKMTEMVREDQEDVAKLIEESKSLDESWNEWASKFQLALESTERKQGISAQQMKFHLEMAESLKILTEKEKEDEEDMVKLEERAKSMDEQVNKFASESDLVLEKQDISEIKGGKAEDMNSAEEENKDNEILTLEGEKQSTKNRDHCEQLETQGQNMLTTSQQFQLEMKQIEKTLLEKINEEKVKFEEEISALKVKVEELEKKNSEGSKAEPEVMKTTEIFVNKQMTSFDLINGNGIFTPHNNNCESQKSAGGEWFKWRGYPVVASIRPWSHKNGDYFLSLNLEYQNPEKFRSIFHLLPTVHYVLRDRRYSGFRPICRNAFYLFGTSSEFNNKYKSVFKHFSIENLARQSVEVYVEPYSMAQRAHSYDGTLNWTIDNFYKRKLMERMGQIEYQESPYFYTGPKGYRVQLHVYLDGVGKNKQNGMTAQISFLTGEFDEELSHDFPHRTTITLINENDSEFNVTKSVEKNLADGKSYLIDLCDNKQVLYCMEIDNLIINVTIKTLTV